MGLINKIGNALGLGNVLDNLFESKHCNICGSPISLFDSKKLKDGFCCKNCIAKLSPFFTGLSTSSVAEIMHQLNCRQHNIERLQQFNPTTAFGTTTKVLIDEDKSQFVVTSSTNSPNTAPDVIDCSSITNCFIDIDESKEEIKYEDSSDNTRSFNPPCYAYSYNFYIQIELNVPYISTIRFKLNDSPIDNGQEKLVHIETGLLGLLTDVLLPAKSYNGKTSNADEVRACSQYKKCEQTANEIRNALLNSRSAVRSRNAANLLKVKCPWCRSKIPTNEQGVCNRCGGPLDI